MLRKYFYDNQNIMLAHTRKINFFCIVKIYLEYYYYIQKDQQIFFR
jgi:hypothetical protein